MMKLFVAVILAVSGAVIFLIHERMTSDMAMRIHNSLRNGAIFLRWSGNKDHFVHLYPNRSPRHCGEGIGYGISVTPSDSTKGLLAQIHVDCAVGNDYSAPTSLAVLKILRAQKQADEPITFRLGRHGDNAEILALE